MLHRPVEIAPKTGPSSWAEPNSGLQSILASNTEELRKSMQALADVSVFFTNMATWGLYTQYHQVLTS